MCACVCLPQYGGADAVSPTVRKPPLGQTQLWHGIGLLTSLITHTLDYEQAHKQDTHTRESCTDAHWDDMLVC